MTAIRKNNYDPVIINYTLFLKGQKDALEDFEGHLSKMPIIQANPIISDLNEILSLLQLHKENGGHSISASKITDFLDTHHGYYISFYSAYLLQILDMLKFTTGIASDFMITPIGEQYLKTKNKKRLYDFLENYYPDFSIKGMSRVQAKKNPSRKLKSRIQ